MEWHSKDFRLVPGFIFFLLIMMLLPTIAFSGLLLEGRLQPVGSRTATSIDRNVTLTLRLYDDEFSGRMLYAEAQKVPIDKKTSLSLGQGQTLEGQPDTGLTPDKLWLEVTIGDAVMNPRLNLAELETSYDLRSDTGWTMVDVGLRGVGNSTLTIDNDGITLDEVKTPLTLSGSVENNGTLQATNSGSHGRGLHGLASGFAGNGVYGEATGVGGNGFYGIASESGSTNTGGYFEAKGSTGSTGVCGIASNTSSGITNYGGRFSASGSLGRGVYGSASGAAGHGVHGEASGSAGYGVCGKATNSSSDFTNYGGYFTAEAGLGRGVYGGATATGNVTNYGGYFEATGDTGRGVYGEATGISGLGVYGKTTGDNGNAVYGYASGSAGNGVFGAATGSSGHAIHGYATATGDVTNYGGYFIANGNSGYGVYGSGKSYGFYAGGTGTNYGPFTGAHDVRLADTTEEMLPGMIVVCTGQTAVREEADKPCLSSTLPTVTLAAKAADKKVFGVLVKECPLPKNHWYEADDDEHFGIVNALGEGLVWVCDINGDIETGDYITTSTVAGYGQLQNDDLVHSYTLGKATADVDWENVTKTVDYNGRKVKIYLIPVVYTSG